MRTKELLLYAKTWMVLIIIMLNERIQTHKNIYCMTVHMKYKYRQN